MLKLARILKEQSLVLILIVTALLSTLSVSLDAANHNYNPKMIFETDGVIWGFDFISPTEMLITLREGELLYIDLAKQIQKSLPVPSISAKGQGGLLDVHFKNIEGKDYIYLTHSTNHKRMLTTALTRGLWNNGELSELQTLFTAKVNGSSGRHFGSRLLFKDGYIYMTIGDRGEREYAQDLSYHNGKILRLDLNGKPAKGNPFESKTNALPEIWSYGHRNPQGIDLDPVSNLIYSCEFGPRGGDELNLINPSVNYGWPEITYGREYWGSKIGTTHNPNMEQPIVHWVPSISPSGMAFYRGDKLPQWKNNLFLAALGSTHLRRLVIKDQKVVEQETLFENLDERLRHVRSAPDGFLYFSTDGGRLYRVTAEK